MKIIQSFFIVMLLFTGVHTYPQAKVSEVTYKVRSIQDVDKIKNIEVKTYLTEIYGGFKFLKYSLVFNPSESVFQEIKKMELDQNKGSLLSSISQDMAFTGKVYTNTDSGLILHQKELSSDIFIVKYNIKDYNWVLTKESKKIGNYNCFKATLVDSVETIRGKSPKLITAWYAPGLPYSFGPAEYTGLPGLVLEMLVNNNILFYADKIELNKPSNAEIKAPTKGKRISEKEFHEIEKKGFSQYKRN